jgi:hypothetical protein
MRSDQLTVGQLYRINHPTHRLHGQCLPLHHLVQAVDGSGEVKAALEENKATLVLVSASELEVA